jgi:hypothetical protein
MRRFLALCLSLAALPALADVPQVTLVIRFDPAAAQALAASGERVVVAGYFYGDPAPGATETPDEVGYINLGTEEVTIRPQDARLTLGASLSNAPLDQVTAPMVNVNVYSARWTHEDNLLDCGVVDGPVAAMTAPQEVFCKLLP